MEILYYKNLDSTHLEILRVLKKTKKEICIVADIQSSGIGSRNNSWQSHYGNLFFSFSIDNSKLPSDLKLQSYSIYFGYLLKSVLVELGFDVWFKWPNDIYKQNRKIAGVITSVKSGFIICGIGVNLISTNEYKGLDATVSKDTILKIFFDKIKKNITWQEVFSKFSVEFHSNKNYQAHINDMRVNLNRALLDSDGSLIIDGKKVYELR